jgi:glutamyl-Q tRNA(Asp) synthetase
VEDLDAARVQPGAADRILSDLEAFGFTWDGPPVYQSARIDTYLAVFNQLRDAGKVYPCGCSRRDLSDGGRYSGTCAAGLRPGKEPRSWRLRVAPGEVSFQDRLQGRQSRDPAAITGDFVVLRADGPFSYQFAVVVDDEDQCITDIVRGNDLLDATHGQIYLQRMLGYSEPAYLHVPVVTDSAGEKLSKQTGAQPIAKEHAAELLCDALAFLGCPPPRELEGASTGEIMAWSTNAWRSAIGL